MNVGFVSECRGPRSVLQLDCQFSAELPVAALKMSSLSFWQEPKLSLVPFTSYFQLPSPLVGFDVLICCKVRCGRMTRSGPSQPLWTRGTNEKAVFVMCR